MQDIQAIDLDKAKPYNYTKIIQKTDELISILYKLNAIDPIYQIKIRHLEELKHRYNMTRYKHKELFTD